MLLHLHPETLDRVFLAVTGQPIPPHWTYARAANHLHQCHALATGWHLLRTAIASAAPPSWRHDSMAA